MDRSKLLLQVLKNRAKETGNPFRKPQKPTDGDDKKKKKKGKKPDGSSYS